MSKKKNLLSAEELAAKKLNKSNNRTRILAVVVALAIAVGVFYSGKSASVKASGSIKAEETDNTVNANSSSVDNSSSNSSVSSDANSTNTDNTDTANNDNNSTNSSNTDNSDSKDNAGASGNAATSLSASSSTAEIVNYFNTAINKVKPSAKQVTLVKEENKEAGGIEGNLPGSLTSVANSLISSNMGEKDLSKLDPGMVNATTVEQKNAMFPVEGETWSSKLTADDVEKAEVQDNGGKYVITLHIKADEPSESTAHGQGHNGKIFSVIMPSIVTDNAGPAASIIKEVKTGHKDGIVKITVDKATGNVTDAFYSFVWTLSLKALGAELSIPFGLEKTFTIAW